ncbi:major facilitator superfamily domain-containing protein [Mariannaea sp. PMI_226]|nr:major facilitator superfamily domain-containing protein [Mariannaea sp. PMI_226]
MAYSEQYDPLNPTSSYNTAIQNVVDNMIADTEAYLSRFRQQRPVVPTPPSQAYVQSRSSSGNSTSSRKMVTYGPARHPSFATNMSWSSSPEYRPVYTDDEVLSPISSLLQPELESDPEPQPEYELEQEQEQEQEQDIQPVQQNFTIPNDLIRLATPRLPPRLDTPDTLTSRYTAPISSTDREHAPLSKPNPKSDAHYPEVPLYEGGLVETSRHFGPCGTDTHEYVALRPEVVYHVRDASATAHVRSGSEGQSLLSQNVRRKPSAPEAKTVRFNYSFSNQVAFVFLICMAQVLTWAGFTQALIAVRELSVSFPQRERTSGHQVWYTSAYVLGTGACILFGHRLGRIFGQKNIFIIGYIWLGFWSLLAGLSSYFKVSGGGGISTACFCLCRGFQGIGPALLIPNGQVLLQRAYPPGKHKAIVMALFDASTPLGFVVGSAMASLFAYLHWWAWAYYSLCAVCVALAATSVLILPPQATITHDLEGGIWCRLDIINFLVGLAGLVIFCAGWNQVTIVSFKNPEAYVLLGVGVLLTAIFIYLETRARHPLVPFKQIDAPAVITLGCAATSWAAFGIWVWYLIQFMQALRGWTPLKMSAGFVPLLAMGLLTAVLYSQVTQKNTAPYFALVVSAMAVLVSSVLVTAAPVGQSYWCNVFLSILTMPVGMVLSFPATTGVLSRSLPGGYQDLASSLTGASAAYSLAISLGVAGVVERDILNRGGTTLKGYRAAQYLGLGLSGLSLILALALLLMCCLRRGNRTEQDLPSVQTI